MIPELSDHQLRLLRCRANRLQTSDDPLPNSVLQAVQSIFAVQAQELPAAYLSLRARSRDLNALFRDHLPQESGIRSRLQKRSRDLTASGIEQVRLEERTLVWTWSLRGTLHLLAAEDARWLLPLLAPGLMGSHQARFRHLGWDAENSRLGLRLLESALQEQPELSRIQVAALLEAQHLPNAGQATVHLLYRAALDGILCAGALRGGKPTYVSFERWAGGFQPVPVDEALSRLALRYLAAYAPARPADLASWSGLKSAQAKRAFELVADRLVQVEYDGQVGWMLESQESWLDEAWLDEAWPSQPLVRLLPRFDTFLMGYASRDFIVSPEHARRINAGGGILHPVLLVDGQALGTWSMQLKARLLKISLSPFEEMPDSLLPFIEQEAQDLMRFLELDEHTQLEIAW